MSRRHPACVVVDCDAFIFDPVNRCQLTDLAMIAPTYGVTSGPVEPIPGIDIRQRRHESLSHDVLMIAGLRPFVMISEPICDQDVRILDRHHVAHLVIKKTLREHLGPHALNVARDFVARQS